MTTHCFVDANHADNTEILKLDTDQNRFQKCDRKEFYRDTSEAIPAGNMPAPRGNCDKISILGHLENDKTTIYTYKDFQTWINWSIKECVNNLAISIYGS